jgi:hypothetical protein
MSLRLSTNLRNRMLGDPVTRSAVVTYTATTIAAVDGGGGLADSFTDSANGFLTAGFSAGDAVIVTGFTGGMQYIVGPFTIVTAAVGTLTVATGLLTADAATEAVTMVALKGGSLKDIFKDGVLRIYSGTQPATADAVVAGTLLLEISVASGAFVAGAVANGLEFGTAAAGAISKNSEVWSDTGIATGTAGWFRLYANAADGGTADTTPFLYPRIDGAVATSGAELNMSSTAITAGATTTIDSFTITFPGV